MGIGVALARAGSERRRLRGRSLGLGPDERLAAGLRRMALGQSEMTIVRLEQATPATMGRTVHDARKAIKRLRTIVRLLEGQLGADVCAREQAALRRAAGALAGARDAEVMLATLDRLVERHPGALSGKRQIERLRKRMARERDRAERRAADPASRLAAVNELRAFQRRAAAWPLLEAEGLGSIDRGLRRIYRDGRRRRRRAARKRAGMRAMHQWRKRVKDLRYALEALERAEPVRRGSRSRRERARAESRWLHRAAKRADELGELLGEEHDLAVLGRWLERNGRRRGLKRGMRRKLQKLIAKRRSELRRRALRDSAQIYERSPEQFMTRLRLAFERTGPKLS